MNISDLHDQPQFFKTVADRIWNAWWRPHGHDLGDIETGLAEMLKRHPVPFAVVAHEGDIYLGSALGIASDMDERPQYTPWVAAVWVEPEHRLKKVGRRLVAGAFDLLVERGFEQVYLCSRPVRRDFYIQGGWRPIEENVGKFAQTVYVRTAGEARGLDKFPPQ